MNIEFEPLTSICKFELNAEENALSIYDINPKVIMDWYFLEIHSINIEYSKLMYNSSNIMKFLDANKHNFNHISINNCDMQGCDFSGYTNLINLTLTECNIRSIDHKSLPKGLLYLTLSNNEIEDISFVKFMNDLSQLCVDNNKIKNIPSFSNNIKILNFADNKIVDISSLSNYNHYVRLTDNPVDWKTINLYKSTKLTGNYIYIGGYPLRFANYRNRIILTVNSNITLPIRKKIMNLWILFFEEKRDKDNYNRLSYLSCTGYLTFLARK